MLSIPDEYRKDKQLQCSHCGEIFNNYMIKKKKQLSKVDKFLITLAIFLTLWGGKSLYRKPTYEFKEQRREPI